MFAGFTVPVVSSVVIFVLNLLSAVVLTKCIRISKQQRVLTMNLLFVDSTMHLILIIFILLITFHKDPTIKFVIVNVLTLLQGSVALMYFALVIVIAFDRLLAIRFPHSYLIIMSGSNIRIMLIVIYLAAAILIVGIGISTPAVYCRNNFTTCREDMVNAFLPAEAIQISLLVLADISVASVGIYIFKVSREHTLRLRARYPSSRLNTDVTAMRIIIHVGAFTFVFSAALIFMALKNIAYFHLSNRIEYIARTLAYVCILANSVVSLYYYVFIKAEFRLICRRLFCGWNNNFDADYERRRIEIYNVPTRTSDLNPSV